MSPPPVLGLQACAVTPALSLGSVDLNSDPHVYPAGSLLTEPSTQLSTNLFSTLYSLFPPV